MKKTPTTLIIMDGWGVANHDLILDAQPGNAVLNGNTPRLDGFLQKYANTALSAAGLDAGLPEGQPGDSAAGHAAISAGRVVLQDLSRLNTLVENGGFARNPVLLRAMDACREQGTALHLAGLLSDGGVHAHVRHLYALLRLAQERGCPRVWIHAFLDGRDVPSGTALSFVEHAEAYCRDLGVGKIATVMGRVYAMDRDANWDLTGMAYDAMVYGQSDAAARPASEAVRAAMDDGVPDAAMNPVVCDPEGTLSDNDSVIFFNFRPDRIRQLVQALADPAFDRFTRQFFPLHIVTLTDCGVSGASEAFPEPPRPATLTRYLSGLGLTQLRIAETGAPAFFGVPEEEALPGEDRILIPSPRPSAYSLQPELSAGEVCRACVEKIEAGAYDVLMVNFANCDLVGHTGSLKAAVRAVETVDECVGKVVDATLKLGGIAMITASHGNAERMLCPDGTPNPANTACPVPFILCGAATKLRPGRLSDVAPTLLDVMGLDCPEWMEGKTLIVE